MKIQFIARLGLAAAFVCPFISSAHAQNDINRNEFFFGYSHNRIDTGLESEDIGPEFNSSFGTRLAGHGFNGSYTRNFTKYVGAKFDFAAHGANETVTFEGDQFALKDRIQNYLGGIQVKNNLQNGPRVKPFFHALAGLSHQTVRIQSPVLEEDFENGEIKISQNNFAFAVGGGLDILVNKRFDIRVFQFDYNPTYIKGRDFGEFSTDSVMQHNYRFGFGIVIH